MFIPKLLPLIPEHETYVEPFAGGPPSFSPSPKSTLSYSTTSSITYRELLGSSGIFIIV